MSCNSCGTKFNFFHKEIGCTNCSLSFCSKCLKQKCKIPNKGNADQNVCKLCYRKFAAGSSNSKNINITPPDAYIKRLGNLENPASPPITIYQKNSKLEKLRTGLSPADIQILDRLEKLRENKNKITPPPSESEIRIRLANLKEENQYVEGPIKSIHLPDTRTDQQKVDSLLEQFAYERGIELARNPQDEIEARLASLREQGVRPNEGAYISNLHDSTSNSDENIDQITKKIMAEVAIDKKYSTCYLIPSTDTENILHDESPELPWCVLCNKDGCLRCLNCSGDIYCVECCKQVHKEFDETDHKIVPFKPKYNTD